MNPSATDIYFTPPQLAKRWKVKPESIIRFIRNGELRAFDVSHHAGVGRPRFRITTDAVEEFEAMRSGAAPKVPKRKIRPVYDLDEVAAGTAKKPR